MTVRKSLLLFFILPLIIVAVGLGCSDKTFTSSTRDVSEDASPLAYIPLEQGLRVNYAIFEDQQTRYFELEVTNPVTIHFNAGFQIRRTDRSTGEIGVVYRYVKDNAIFESTSTDDPGYKILEGPFVAGHSWNRYDTSTNTSSTSITDITDDGFDGKDGLTIFGDGYKVLPDENFGTMSIVGFEDVEALNNVRYGRCLKVEWQIDPLRTYNYWYVSGIGLVKFEETLNTLYADKEPVTVLMTDYQVVKY